MDYPNFYYLYLFQITLVLLLLVVITNRVLSTPQLHHTSYGAPFGVPSHGSTDFLSPFGANSLSSVLTALGIGQTLTPASTATTSHSAGPPNSPGLIITNDGTLTRDVASIPQGNTQNTLQPATNSQTNLATNDALVSDFLPSRIEPPLVSSVNTNALANVRQQSRIPNNFRGHNRRTHQTPFIVVIPQPNSQQNTAGGHDVQPVPVGLQSKNRLSGQGLTRTQPSGAAITSAPHSTPVFVVLDPASIQQRAGAASSVAGRASTTGTVALDRNALNALLALANRQPTGGQPPETSAVPTINTHQTLPSIATGSATTALPPFPGPQTRVDTQINEAQTTSTVEQPPVQNQQSVDSVQPTNHVLPDVANQGTTTSSIPVAQELQLSVTKGPIGNYMYSFIISGADGVTRHEVGEIAPGTRKTSRTVVIPAAALATSSTSATAETQPPASGGAQPPATAGATPPADFNIFGNYS